MFTIGDFARHGRVSVRMLRHYDAIGLLRPAHVDPSSGYRFYEAAQLSRLNRVVALKELGFTLAQVHSILDEQVSTEQLRGMLRLRRAELAAAMAADAARLAQVEARLQIIESEGRMSVDEVVIKSIAPLRLAELSGTAASYSDIGPVIGPLYQELFGRLVAAGVHPAGPNIAYYEDAADGSGGSDGSGDSGGSVGSERVVVHAGVIVDVEPNAEFGFAVVDLPPVKSAATVLHRGSMDGVLKTYQDLATWIDANGYRVAGPAREFYLECPADSAAWLTEIQFPVIPAS